MTRVGMFAQGSGASIGILASAVDPRIRVLDALDAWGDWRNWMKTSPFVPEEERAQYVQPEFLKKAAALDPVDWLPKIQAKKFRLQDAIFEPNTPKVAKKNCARPSLPAQSSSCTKPRKSSMRLYATRRSWNGSSTSLSRCWMQNLLTPCQSAQRGELCDSQQVRTGLSRSANHSSRGPVGPFSFRNRRLRQLLTGGRTRRAQCFRRIKKTLVPKCRVGQRARLPLLQRRKSGGDHATIGGIEDQNDSCQIPRLPHQ